MWKSLLHPATLAEARRARMREEQDLRDYWSGMAQPMQRPRNRPTPTEMVRESMRSVNEERAGLGLPLIADRGEAECVFAYPPPGHTFPPYLNVTRAGNRYLITVRPAAGAAADRCSDTAMIVIDRERLLELFRALASDVEVAGAAGLRIVASLVDHRKPHGLTPTCSSTRRTSPRSASRTTTRRSSARKLAAKVGGTATDPAAARLG
jgi:hypothetical protein